MPIWIPVAAAGRATRITRIAGAGVDARSRGAPTAASPLELTNRGGRKEIPPISQELTHTVDNPTYI